MGYDLTPEQYEEFMLTIISQMAALFILILVGYGAAKLKIIDGTLLAAAVGVRDKYQQPLPDSLFGNGRYLAG